MRREREQVLVGQGAGRRPDTPKQAPAAAERGGASPLDAYARLWMDAASYWADAWQRGVLYLDVMRRRGNQYHEHMAEKAPHVLSFTGELVGASDDEVTVAADGGVVTIPYTDINRSNLLEG